MPYRTASTHRRSIVLVVTTALAMLVLGGCVARPNLYQGDKARVVDRKYVEYPSGYALALVADHLNAPAAVAFTPDGLPIVVETGVGDVEPRIYGWRADGTKYDIHPRPNRSPFGLFEQKFHIYGPVGGMIYHDGSVYVTHRDENRLGVITRFGLDGSHSTVVADLPAQGDYGMTDLTVSSTGRIVFGLGTATNSGVVGLDNFATGWVQRYPKVSDQPYTNLKLLGYRFDTPNPNAGLFGGNDVSVTAPFQPFGVSNQTRISKSPTEKPTGAIYSVSTTGGDLTVEAFGIHVPRGLEYNEFGRLYMTNNGMELRGTRPIQDDPDALLRVVKGTWYGWPDYTADLRPVSELQLNDTTKAMILKSGYPDLSSLVDHNASNLLAPNRETLVTSVFPSLSGAAKFDFVPADGPFAEFAGNAIVALSGDTAPFATGGQRLKGPVGYKVVRVDIDTRQYKDFIYNTKGKPASLIDKAEVGDALERPIDVKFAPDGSLYVLDLGRLRMRGGREEIAPNAGRLFRLIPLPPAPATQPTTTTTSTSTSVR
jgi:glucose/arabinose dehydrogenase